MPTDITLRPARPGDAEPLARLYGLTRAAAAPEMPPAVHTAHEDDVFFAALLTSEHSTTWVAETTDGRPVGFAVVQEDWLHSLYVHPDHAGTGIGSALLDVAKSLRPEGFCLWVFESNASARRFYARRGLIELERTDGSGNEEGAPDLKMAWPGSDPIRFFRRLIDDIDDQVAELLHRRTALTGAVHRVRRAADPVAGRDAGREREIARRMARRAPELGEQRLARIVDVIITESLDAATGG